MSENKQDSSDFKVISKNDVETSNYSREDAFNLHSDSIEDTYNTNNSNDLNNLSSTAELENEENNNENNTNEENNNENNNNEEENICNNINQPNFRSITHESDFELSESESEESESDMQECSKSSDEIYVITMNDEPIYYVNDLRMIAYRKMQEHAIQYINNLKIINSDYTYYMEFVDYSICIEEYYKFSFMAIGNTHAVFKIHKVNRI